MHEAPEPSGKPILPPWLTALLQRAIAGDRTVLPELKTALDEHPEVVGLVGTLRDQAKTSLLNLLAGNNLLAKETIERDMNALRERFVESACCPLEEMLIDRLLLDYLHLHHADIYLAERAKADGASPRNRGAELRLDAAHSRYLASVRALGTFKRLVLPVLEAHPVTRRIGSSGDPEWPVPPDRRIGGRPKELCCQG